MVAIVPALNAICVCGLKQTWKKVPALFMRQLNECEAMFKSFQELHDLSVGAACLILVELYSFFTVHSVLMTFLPYQASFS
jgi:hypothetical protein